MPLLSQPGNGQTEFMKGYLESGRWFNASKPVLAITAALTALGFVAFCLATEYFVAQYFICIGNCKAGSPPVLLILVSGFFALIPALGTGVLGYWIVKGLWEDARQVEAEEAGARADLATGSRAPSPGT
jgi:hypothetical protein